MSEEQSAAPNEVAVPEAATDDIARIKAGFHARLIAAGLRAEALRAGMIDLDGLKLVDAADITLNDDDTIANGEALMQTLRRSKPWLFRSISSSSASAAPMAKPVRSKSAMEMSDEEYRAARQALLKS